MLEPRLGVIGGSGLYAMPQLHNAETVEVSTPFGAPSSPITVGTVDAVPVAFIARHGIGHTLLPSEVPYRANIWALKSLGVSQLLSVSAVGSLREDYAPRDIVIPDQIFDRTRARSASFFGRGLVAHVAFGNPFCPALTQVLFSSAQATAATVHWGGALVVIEGPAFSTVAESEAYRKLGFSIIGMTAIPEAKLAREAELCYATLAMVTDYDVWHPTHDSVTSDMVAQTLRENIDTAHSVVANVSARVTSIGVCHCQDSLASALLTPLDLVPAETLTDLEPLLAKYMGRMGRPVKGDPDNTVEVAIREDG